MEITKEMDLIYRQVRAYYAKQDVIGWLEDHGINPEKCNSLENLADAYDKWQGSNDYWYEAIGTLASSFGIEAEETGKDI